MKRIFFLTILSLFFFTDLISQTIPTIYATGGMSPNDWVKYVQETIETYDPDGLELQGFGVIDNPCAQGLLVQKASSTLDSQGKNNYFVENINDYNHKTAWVEGKSDYGIGEYFIVESIVVNIIYNGYQKSKSSWSNNSRVKKFKVYQDNVPLCYLILNDVMGGQFFDLPESELETIYKFEIVEVYKGERWNDVAITHIDFQGCCVLDESIVLSIDKKAKNISKFNKGDFISTIDIESQKIIESEINQVFKQNHHELLEIITPLNKIKATKDHPFYIKDYGFISLRELLKKNKLKDYSCLNNQYEILVWDSLKKQTDYKPISEINLIKGNFTTYTILDINNGFNYIVNGFITRTY